ncbi:hypothetical protein GN244_ATG13036 [Phytophthora infestans]|uniref:Uncharacterized protein n=1 Tax=Phytophthora infestans TaxID=4787 RepID=A0A833VZ30_PHYIN|nr:hypothetical protein GN244_ATG13036 [Phytophthora infestans]
MKTTPPRAACRIHSTCWSRSNDFWVMSPTRFLCAKVLAQTQHLPPTHANAQNQTIRKQPQSHARTHPNQTIHIQNNPLKPSIDSPNVDADGAPRQRRCRLPALVDVLATKSPLTQPNRTSQKPFERSKMKTTPPRAARRIVA